MPLSDGTGSRPYERRLAPEELRDLRAMMCQMVSNREDIALATDVWLPDGPGPFPVLLTRTPYHRAGAGGAAKRYTDLGYAYVVQDARGKYDSEGVFRPLVHEAADGHDTLDWIANQKWCNGRIGMVGRSYLGIVQIPAASGGHEALRCIVPGVAPNEFFTDWIRYDGCFALANMVRWPLTHAVCPTKPSDAHFTWEELWALRTLDEIEQRIGCRAPELREWVARDQYDEYWEAINQQRMYESVTVPGMHVGGWFDHLTRGQFQAFKGIGQRGATEAARAGQRLFILPCGHSTLGQREYGEWDFGPDAETDTLAYEQRFIDLWMRDIDDGISEEPPVRAFLMGENRWMSLSDWPPPEAEAQQWYLHSGGSAVGLGSDGRLSRESPGDEPADTYQYAPKHPAPSRGGPLYWGIAQGLGPVDQHRLLRRDDVLYYRGEVLPHPVAVVGEVNLELWIASSATDTDFIAKLCVVEASGRVTCLTSGCLRCRYRESWSEPKALTPGEPTKLRIQMNNLAYVFPAGSRIALTITSSSFPRILPHPNTMAPTWQETSPQVARQEILHSRGHESGLLLPVVD